MEMESVYGRKRTANDGVIETWMDRFTQLEPEGGFRSVVRLASSRSVSTLNGASRLTSLNGHVEMKPVYGQQRRSSAARETWMDRFTRIEPEGGFRASVELAWNASAAAADTRPQSLAA
jgi:hypothetical protein